MWSKEVHVANTFDVRDGRDLDGTVILTSPSQIDNLVSKGLVELRGLRLTMVCSVGCSVRFLKIRATASFVLTPSSAT